MFVYTVQYNMLIIQIYRDFIYVFIVSIPESTFIMRLYFTNSVDTSNPDYISAGCLLGADGFTVLIRLDLIIKCEIFTFIVSFLYVLCLHLLL